MPAYRSRRGPMTMRPAASRLVTLATLAALAASIVGTTAADARSGSHAPDRSIRIGQDPGREQSGVRSYRHVDVAKLPASTGKASPVNPALAAPADRFHTKAPIGITAATGPTFATTNADPAITEATSYPGLAFDNTPPTSTSRRAARPVGRRRAGARCSGRQHGVPLQQPLGHRAQDRRHVRLLRPRRLLRPGRGRLLRPARRSTTASTSAGSRSRRASTASPTPRPTSAPATSTSRSRTAPTRRWAGASSRSATPTPCPTTRASAPRPTRSS